MESASILVVDDEPGITLLCERFLKRAGHQVTLMVDPRKAMKYLQENPVDLLLVDIRMPDVDGFGVVAHAKQYQPDMAVLIMTGFGTVETAIRALRQGVDGLILKPFEDGSELIAAVEQALVDNQKKRDLAQVQALRPLFNVTESLFAETNQQRLLKLIINAINGHLRCSHTGYYSISDDGDNNIQVLAESGAGFFDGESGQRVELLKTVNELGVPIWINASGPGEEEFQQRLKQLNLGSAMFVPVIGPNTRWLLFSGRSNDEPAFREADLEMFLILARQATVAMENARLYSELRDYVKRVEESQQALLQAEKMASAGRLTASIAHEINNPLQAVQNCLHLSNHAELSEEKRREYYDMAMAELERLMTTVRRMLDFYRPGAVAPKKVDLSEMLNHVLGLMSQQLSTRKINIETDIPENLPKVNVVSNQIQQVFINLVLNAFDAMAEGGVLEISARRARRGVEIFFQDDGLGIPLDKRPNIFDPFFSTKEGGTGLGLTVSYNIINAHGGSLDLVAGRGSGACFRVYLPTGGK
ncbi:MAG: response regulator [Anaerolineales bacterium]|nr:response regulator [Anaerolineales bacterium]